MLRSMTALACLISLFTSGCATLVGHDSQSITVSSQPPEADLKVVDDDDGQIVFRGKTPTVMTLNKSSGHFFGGKTYTVTLSKEGFAPQEIHITHHANGWYKFGNIFPAGPIGYFAVDPFHGAMYDLDPDAIDLTLTPQ